MIKYFCDTCGKETTIGHEIDADTFEVLCQRCKPKKVIAAAKKHDLTIRPVAGAWTRRTDRDRQKYAKDILQPYTPKGHVNEKFIAAYGAKKFYPKEVQDHYTR